MLKSNTFNRPVISCYILSFNTWMRTIFFASAIPNIVDNRTKLYIGGFFPISGTGGWQGGRVCEPAAEMALHDVNMDKDLLPGYQLKMQWNDSQCEHGRSAQVFYDLIYNDPVKVMLLAGCSSVCTQVAESAKEWSVNVLCYGASSPTLSDRNRFETLFRTHPSATVHNPTRIKLMQTFGWSRIALIVEADEIFVSTVHDLEERCKKVKIEVVSRVSFLTDPTDAVRGLARNDARIFVGLFYATAARKVLCEIYKQNLFGRQYAWFFLGWYEDNWYELSLEEEGIGCSVDEMRMAAESHLTTEVVMWSKDTQTTISGMNVNEFRDRLNEELLKRGFHISKGRYPEGYPEAPLAYDAVWAIALALNKSIERLSMNGAKLEDFHYGNEIIRNEIYEALNRITFLGVSGRVSFNEKGENTALIQVEQMVNGTSNLLGYFNEEGLNLSWKGGAAWTGGKIPQDRTILKVKLRKITLSLLITISSVASVGILCAIFLIIFNYSYRDRKVIQQSVPLSNTIMLTGHALCFVSIFLFGLDGRIVSDKIFHVTCTLKKWFLSTGFTLAYGSMLSKIWMVNHLMTTHFTASQNNIQKWKLYIIVATLTGFDVIFLSIWTLVDPLQRIYESFELENPSNFEEDVKILPQLEHCESAHTIVWLGITYSFKGLLLLYGFFLATKTRSFKVNCINDSHLVELSIYITAVVCLVVAPLTMTVSFEQHALYTCVTLTIIFLSMISMSLIYIPKVIIIIRERHMKSVTDKTTAVLGETHDNGLESGRLQKILERKEIHLRYLRQQLEERNKRGILKTPPASGPSFLT